MREPKPVTIHLKDYRPPAFLVETVELDVDLRDADAVVRATLAVRRNPAARDAKAPLELDGEALKLESVALDGKALAAKAYTLTPQRLTIPACPDAFTLETVSRIVPQKNTTLEGLYAATSGFVTQCEAQGFRRITWFPDRPDVMSRYRTTIRADKARYPVLLSNGNPDGAGDEDGGRHWARFDDPFLKPAYLFALVAAKLDSIEDTFVTRSGRTARLRVYVEPGRLTQADWSMNCLKRAMKWDEDRFGLELDLDHYTIVAVSDFNSGAMENKGLNIFNAKFVLARPDTATDTDYVNIDRVVAHEYFHNWTGNRVTCRDWFQLSLKEGLTVFRDQEYGADTYSRAVSRIQEVRQLRAAQFPEDAGPMAHPVRPQSYMEIRNFYTMTVYEKGAELVRMQHALLGEEKFQAGMRLYFERHDGQAVTCDDFVQAMQDASGIDLTQFRRWYDRPGTPVLDCSGAWDAAAKRFTLSVRQSMNPPFHIPLAVKIGATEQVLALTEVEQRFEFDGLQAAPVPSLLRRFSAPVILNYPYTEAELVHLMSHDDDAFNRWEAGQRLATMHILEHDGAPSPAYVEAFGRLLATADEDPAFTAEAIAMPTESTLAEQGDSVDPDALHAARNRLRRALAEAHHDALLAAYHASAVAGPYAPEPDAAGRRSLRNAALGYLMELETPEVRALCHAQYARSDNMTESFAALACLAGSEAPERVKALDAFYARWKDEPLVVDKWLSVQATSRLPGTLEQVKSLLGHPAFDLRVPNKVYALIRGFSANHVRFHAADGSGYAFLGDRVIELNKLNPQVAARMARGFDRWKRFDAGRQTKMRAQLERIRDAEGLSNDVAEIVVKALG
ncbi:MAG TPA: aminopeptidase N [Burkholderiales bacterium]